MSHPHNPHSPLPFSGSAYGTTLRKRLEISGPPRYNGPCERFVIGCKPVTDAHTRRANQYGIAAKENLVDPYFRVYDVDRHLLRAGARVERKLASAFAARRRGQHPHD